MTKPVTRIPMLELEEDYYPGFSGVDRISSEIPSYMKKDISGVWHDTRRFVDGPPGYDWRTGRGARELESWKPSLIAVDDFSTLGTKSSVTDDVLAKALESMYDKERDPFAPREITYIDETGSATPSIFSGSEGVGDIGSGGTVTTPLTAGGFYVPITPHIPIGPGESALSEAYTALGYGSDIYT